MGCIYSLETWKDIEFNTDEIVPWKDGIMWPWVHCICPPMHGEG